jgi:integrase/recombinase XerC
METTTDSRDDNAALTAGECQGFSLVRLNNYLLRFLNNLKKSGKSTHTLAAYRNDLMLFSKFLLEENRDPSAWSDQLSAAWSDYLKLHGRNSAASVRRALLSVRTFLHFLIQEKVIASSPLLEAKSPRQPTHDLLITLPGHFQSLTKFLSRRAHLGDEKSVRDMAIILLLGKCGLKASEAANLKWGDVSVLRADSREGSLRGSVLVRGSNERSLTIDSETALALENLKELRANLGLPTDRGAALFFGYLNLTRQTRTNSLHRHGIKFVVYEACQDILGIPYNSESLRNHAIATWLRMGLSNQRVAELAGYSSLNSLERFSLDSRTIRIPRRQARRSLRE